MAEYTIINVGANKRLNVNGDNVTASSMYYHQNVTMWEKSGTSEQRWIVDNLGNGVYIKSKINQAFGLNVYRSGSPWNCDLYPISGNETDAAVNIIPVGGRYRIQLTNYPSLYLTADSASNGANVYWTELIEGSAFQTWSFYAVPTSCTIPNMPEIFNQWYENNIYAIRHWGCCVCCCCNASTYYRKLKDPSAAEYTIQELGNAPYNAYSHSTGEAYFNNFPDAGFTYIYTSDITQICTKIQAEILMDKPVLVQITKTHKTNSAYDTTHWVVAYGYTGLGDSYSNILVLDPYNSDATASRGRYRTLDAVLNEDSNYYTSINRLEPTYSKS